MEYDYDDYLGDGYERLTKRQYYAKKRDEFTTSEKRLSRYQQDKILKSMWERLEKQRSYIDEGEEEKLERTERKKVRFSESAPLKIHGRTFTWNQLRSKLMKKPYKAPLELISIIYNNPSILSLKDAEDAYLRSTSALPTTPFQELKKRSLPPRPSQLQTTPYQELKKKTIASTSSKTYYRTNRITISTSSHLSS